MMEERRRMKALLKAKGRILQSWLSLSSAFSRSVEGAFDEAKLQEFLVRRSALFDSFKLHEKKITETAVLLAGAPREETFTSDIRAHLSRFEEIHARIQEADDKVLNAIRAEQERLHQGMANTHREAKSIGRFKSEWTGSAGSGLDREA